MLMFVERFFSGVAGLLTFICIARVYGPGVSGDFAYAMTLLQVLAGLSMIVGAQAIVPRMIRRPALAESIAGAVFFARLAWCALLLLVTLPLLIASLDGLRMSAAIVICSMILILEPFMVGSVVSQVHGDFGAIAWVRFVTSTTRLVAILVGSWLGVPPVVLVLAWLAEHLVLAWMQFRILKWTNRGERRKLWRGASRRVLRPYLLFGVRFLPALAAAQFYLRIDRIFLGEHLPRDVYGVYASAMQFIDAWLIVPQLMGLVLGRRYLYTPEGRVSGTGLLTLTWALAGVGIGGGIVASFIGSRALPIVLGSSFQSIATVLPWAFVFSAIFFIDSGFQLALITIKAPALILLKWSLAAAIVMISLTYLTPSLGMIAGPISMASGILGADVVIAALWYRFYWRPSQGPDR